MDTLSLSGRKRWAPAFQFVCFALDPRFQGTLLFRTPLNVYIFDDLLPVPACWRWRPRKPPARVLVNRWRPPTKGWRLRGGSFISFLQQMTFEGVPSSPWWQLWTSSQSRGSASAPSFPSCMPASICPGFQSLYSFHSALPVILFAIL